MGIALFIIAGIQVLGALLVVSIVGKERQPVTHGVAVATVLFVAAMATVLVVAGIRLS